MLLHRIGCLPHAAHPSLFNPVPPTPSPSCAPLQARWPRSWASPAPPPSATQPPTMAATRRRCPAATGATVSPPPALVWLSYERRGLSSRCCLAEAAGARHAGRRRACTLTRCALFTPLICLPSQASWTPRCPRCRACAAPCTAACRAWARCAGMGRRGEGVRRSKAACLVSLAVQPAFMCSHTHVGRRCWLTPARFHPAAAAEPAARVCTHGQRALRRTP